MTTTCIITGGAGFIGTAISRAVADRYDRVFAIDNLLAQVHPAQLRPLGLDERVQLVVGDVTEPDVWDGVLASLSFSSTDDTLAIVHLAAETGTAQSLTESTRHAQVNVVGTTTMLDALTRANIVPSRILLTSSRAVYGEGLWADAHGIAIAPGSRSHEMLESGRWEFDGLTPLAHAATRTPAHPTSVYGATKLAQEHILGAWAMAFASELVVLRLQNVYGEGQSLTNPYTGIVSFFVQRALQGGAIPVYEDGRIVRDFVHITDVAAAIQAALDLPAIPVDAVWDIGTGTPTTIRELASIIANSQDAPEPVITGQFRDGDVRSAFADASPAESALGWRAGVDVRAGLASLTPWIIDQLASNRA